jgi:hypothetical protein
LKIGKAISQQQRTNILLAAETIEQDKYNEISDSIEHNRWISNADLINLQRTSLEKFYRQKISSDLIEFDNQSAIRSKIIRFELLTKKSEFDKITTQGVLLKRSTYHKQIFEDRDLGIILLAMLFTAAGVIPPQDRGRLK